MIRLKRVYDPPKMQDGFRVLVDRIWPRGVRKEDARIDRWLKELAPSTDLRKWFNHEPAKWDRFRERYWEQLDAQREAITLLRERSDGRLVTLVYAAKDREHNNAVALKQYLER